MFNMPNQLGDYLGVYVYSEPSEYMCVIFKIGML